MFNVFTELSRFARNLRTIVSNRWRFYAGVWRAAQRWQLRARDHPALQSAG